MATAQRWLNILREGKKKMKVKFSKEDIGLLVQMVKNPQKLQQIIGAKPYPVDDMTARKEIFDLLDWINSSLIKWEDEAKTNGDLVEGWEGDLKQKYVKRIADVLEHYKKHIMVVPYAMAWQHLWGVVNEEGWQPESVIKPAKE